MKEDSGNFLDLVLSDIHLGERKVEGEDGMHISRFPFYIMKDEKEELVTQTEEDEDGDVILPRMRPHPPDGVVTIAHSLATPLKDVGLQVWRGALLLGDYFVHHRNRLTGVTGLELGAGIGFCSIVLAMVAKLVFITDYDDQILENCAHNVELNKHLFKSWRTSSQIFKGEDDEGHGQEVVKIRKLNWLDSNTWPSTGSNQGPFGWSEGDVRQCEDVGIIFGSDVIYDNDFTDALFAVLKTLLRGGITFLLALEKRFNFSVEEQDVTAQAYDYFKQYFIIEDKEQPSPMLNKKGDDIRPTVPMFYGKQIPIDFPQYFSYERAQELELWAIKYKT